MSTIEVTEDQVPIFIMGKRYEVPESLTIMKALEYAGYQYIRGAGCRGGICGACATIYRKPGDYHIRAGLACQTVVEADMYLTQIPFYPANRTVVDFEALKGVTEEIHNAYPELFRCVACNACTKVCPMDVEVMDYIAAIKQGELKKAMEISFDCIQCGLCATRCMGELPQYHIAQLVRRVYGSKLAPNSEHLDQMVEQIAAGRYVEGIDELKKMDTEGLKKLYVAREMEPAMAPEDWTPKDSTYL
ncbi:MAG: 4Fe-4S dicluster domain-containing protein [Proteobacteria bacterium]|mgnify:CR=1 FL=1|jgi:succinate dehydrogenase/fumarate reductase-like Fe-S protein|nr:4Fe-4S dicluster domain-containing protein [Pseudomonadota bacterium]